jgi:uncharacterized protein (TIGR03435 family)
MAMRRWIASAVLAWLAAHTVAAQTPSPAFEVASVKVNGSGQAVMRLTAPPGTGRFDATNVSTRILILNSHGLRDFQLAGAPAWTESERFDVAGRTDASATRDDISAMVRSLLADRFKLRTHRETREMPTYALVAATADKRPGPGLKLSTADTRTNISPTSISAVSMTMARLALTLSAVVGRVVTDDTGLQGAYDLELRFAREGPVPPGAPPADPDAPSIFTALREQLGLRLEGRRGPVEVLVVDGIERPTPD